MCKAKLFCVSGCTSPAVKAATVMFLCTAEHLDISTVGILKQVLLLLGANCQGKGSELLELHMIPGAKSEMWLTGFHSLLPTWYFYAKYLAYVSGTSLLTSTVENLTLLFLFCLPTCRISSGATAPCGSERAVASTGPRQSCLPSIINFMYL